MVVGIDRYGIIGSAIFAYFMFYKTIYFLLFYEV